MFFLGSGRWAGRLEKVVSADVGGVDSIQTILAMTAARRAPVRREPAPALQLPEERPFEVATINQRLASLAAAHKVDIKV